MARSASAAGQTRQRPRSTRQLVILAGVLGLVLAPSLGQAVSPSPIASSMAVRTTSPTPTIPPAPRLGAAGAILEDLDSGRVLFERNPAQRRPVASLTKIMTAMVVLASAKLDDVVVVRPEAAAQTGSTVGLRAGERLTIRDLLYSALLPSANDAAVALAQHVGGTVDAFVRLMNVTAARMGLHDTYFASPTGLDDRGYSTPADLASLTRRAELNPTFAKIVATVRARIPGPNGSVRRLVTRNILLRVYPGAIGVKSGFTSRAGNCLVGAARLAGFGLLAVVLGSTTNAFDDAIHLLNYGFGAFERAVLLARGDRVGHLVVGGQAVDVVAGSDVSVVVPRTLPRSLQVRFLPDGRLTSPVVAGERVGRVEVRLNGVVVAVVAGLAVPAPNPAPNPAATSSPVGRALLLFTALLRAVLGAFL